MYCENCLVKEDICKPGSFTKGRTMPLLEATMIGDFIHKGYIEKNDREIYEILSESTSVDTCYYEYSKFIYSKYKKSEFTKLCKEQSAIESIIDLLYWSFGSPDDESNILCKLATKKINKNTSISSLEKDHYTSEIYKTLPKTLDKTERETIIKIRLGQELFRKKLFLLEPRCKICGLDIPELLIASHSKYWKESNNFERTDAFNGFLLCNQHDSLYDKGFISFDDNGKIMISKLIDEKDYSLLNINKNIVIKIYEKNKKYLKWHRKNTFKV